MKKTKFDSYFKDTKEGVKISMNKEFISDYCLNIGTLPMSKEMEELNNKYKNRIQEKECLNNLRDKFIRRLEL